MLFPAIAAILWGLVPPNRRQGAPAALDCILVQGIVIALIISVGRRKRFKSWHPASMLFRQHWWNWSTRQKSQVDTICYELCDDDFQQQKLGSPGPSPVTKFCCYWLSMSSGIRLPAPLGPCHLQRTGWDLGTWSSCPGIRMQQGLLP